MKHADLKLLLEAMHRLYEFDGDNSDGGLTWQMREDKKLIAALEQEISNNEDIVPHMTKNDLFRSFFRRHIWEIALIVFLLCYIGFLIIMAPDSTTSLATPQQYGLRILKQDSNGGQWYGTGERYTVRQECGDYITETTYEKCRKL